MKRSNITRSLLFYKYDRCHSDRCYRVGSSMHLREYYLNVCISAHLGVYSEKISSTKNRLFFHDFHSKKLDPAKISETLEKDLNSP